jgi:small multidrug resistance family-3 protein
MSVVRTLALFAATAFAEILGCYLVFAWLRLGRTALVLVPAAASLAVFAWLLTFHPTAAGRTYAAYGGVYVSAAMLWMWAVEGQRPDRWDVLGTVVTLVGMSLIAFPRR